MISGCGLEVFEAVWLAVEGALGLFERFSVPYHRSGREYGTMLPLSASEVSFRLKPGVDDGENRQGISSPGDLQKWLCYCFAYASRTATANLCTAVRRPNEDTARRGVHVPCTLGNRMRLWIVT